LVTTSTSEVAIIDPATLDTLWVQRLQRDASDYNGMSAILDNALYIARTDGRLFALDLDGTKMTETALPAKISGDVFAHNGQLFTRATEGAFSAIR
jgi:outer membrane protein assembly factor BamB